MTINRIGPLEPVQPGKRPGQNEPVGGSNRADTINLSTEAKEKAEKYQVIQLIKSAPDLDDARILELRAQVDDPNYINDRVINATADNIINAWFA